MEIDSVVEEYWKGILLLRGVRTIEIPKSQFFY